VVDKKISASHLNLEERGRDRHPLQKNTGKSRKKGPIDNEEDTHLSEQKKREKKICWGYWILRSVGLGLMDTYVLMPASDTHEKVVYRGSYMEKKGSDSVVYQFLLQDTKLKLFQRINAEFRLIKEKVPWTSGRGVNRALIHNSS